MAARLARAPVRSRQPEVVRYEPGQLAVGRMPTSCLILYRSRARQPPASQQARARPGPCRVTKAGPVHRPGRSQSRRRRARTRPVDHPSMALRQRSGRRRSADGLTHDPLVQPVASSQRHVVVADHRGPDTPVGDAAASIAVASRPTQPAVSGDDRLLRGFRRGCHLADPVRRPPADQPSKVIAAGEQAFIIAFIFVNPTVNIPLGWAIPATVQLAGRTWRMTLDQGNLTTGLVRRHQVVTAAFGPGATVDAGAVVADATPSASADGPRHPSSDRGQGRPGTEHIAAPAGRPRRRRPRRRTCAGTLVDDASLPPHLPAVAARCPRT